MNTRKHRVPTTRRAAVKLAAHALLALVLAYLAVWAYQVSMHTHGDQTLVAVMFFMAVYLAALAGMSTYIAYLNAKMLYHIRKAEKIAQKLTEFRQHLDRITADHIHETRQKEEQWTA